jgi:hypothetical protein
MPSSSPDLFLEPMNPDCRTAIRAERVPIRTLPFRVGRESRFGVMHGKVVSMERRNAESAPNNELYIQDDAEFLNVSREHFQIESKPDGTYELLDRGSTCGTIVDGVAAGGESPLSRCPLKHGSVIRVGTPASPFVFRFVSNGG